MQVTTATFNKYPKITPTWSQNGPKMLPKTFEINLKIIVEIGKSRKFGCDLAQNAAGALFSHENHLLGQIRQNLIKVWPRFANITSEVKRSVSGGLLVTYGLCTGRAACHHRNVRWVTDDQHSCRCVGHRVRCRAVVVRSTSGTVD